MNLEKDIIIYQSADGKFKLDVGFQDETVWLSQQQIAELFGIDRTVVSKHIKNILNDEEVDEKSNVQKMHIANSDKPVSFYNLDIILAVGYRTNSTIAIRFRKWATQTLKEYLIKGFAMDDERLKGKNRFGEDYFKELLERVRSIRASERRIYQQITDIFAECSIDYDPNSEITKNFYATVQNKFHYAITGKTAAEIIYSNADSTKENMGLTTWKNSPDGRILKSDTSVAKNYLDEKQIKRLERTISSYFDYLENIIERGNTFSMKSLSESVNKFLTFNEYEILENKGNISKDEADKKAFDEYDKFNKTQKIISDFDKQIKKLGIKNK